MFESDIAMLSNHHDAEILSLGTSVNDLSTCVCGFDCIKLHS